MSPSNSQRDLYERILNSTSEQELNTIKTFSDGYSIPGIKCPGPLGDIHFVYYGTIPVTGAYYGSIKIF